MSHKVFFGIDLGTTNCSMSFAVDGAGADHAKTGTTAVVRIPQIERPGVVKNELGLPSALYVPFEGEFKNEDIALPWDSSPKFVNGVYARDRAAEVPDRVVRSAKSWLCQSSIDRKSPILPWGSAIEEDKVSPFDATVTYLRHLYEVHRQKCIALEVSDNTNVVITVPASFDEVARNLTAEAAALAGFESVSLLEEPLSALYSWVANVGDIWRDSLQVGQTVLVCDIGGGTADFSLVYVGEENGMLSLTRLSVGEHLLLGGDNMDLALALYLKQKIESTGASLDPWQFQSLIHQARVVKERMFDEPDSVLPVTIAGKGSSLFSNTIKTEISYSEVIELILDGFYPEVGFDDERLEISDSGLSEFGLPYEAEPALTKHLAAFLRRSSKQISHADVPTEIKERASNSIVFPDAVLFNGGACTPLVVRTRLIKVLTGWASRGLTELQGTSLSTAVSEGACYFARVRATGIGIRIKAGIPRSYYIGLKSSMPAVPGFRPPVRGLCVVAQGMEEGTTTDLSKQVFSLLTGQEASFRLFESRERGDDEFGVLVEDAEKSLKESTRVSVSLPLADTTSTQQKEGGDSMQGAKFIPVRVFSEINDVGILELWMQSTEGLGKWKLEFDVRNEAIAEKKTLKSVPSLTIPPSVMSTP